MRIVTNKQESFRAYKALKRQLEAAGTRHVRTLGHSGGHSADLPLFWLNNHRMWAHLNHRLLDDQFWICFGSYLDRPSVSQTITVECNPPKAGINRRMGGVFLRGGRDFFFAHSGRVGGGKPGIGKSAFLQWYDGLVHTIQWPDDHATRVIVIGRIGSREFPSQLARFVHKVEAFKLNPNVTPDDENGALSSTFSSEFRGKVKRSQRARAEDAVYSHGIVVDALRDLLADKSLVANDRQRDLFCVGRNGKLAALFEVKTIANTTALYTGVGQLLVHSAMAARIPRVLVLPEAPKGKLAGALRRLGISVLCYELNDGVVTFRNAGWLTRAMR